MAEGNRADRSNASWLSIGEKGSVLGIRLLFVVATMIGRRAAAFLLHFAVLYFVVVHRQVRRSSRAYLERIHGHRVGLRAIYAHVYCFALVTLDRIFLLQGRYDLFTATHHGHEHLLRLSQAGQGAVLLSAHLGSVAAMNLDDHAKDLRINIVGYFRNARMINSLFEQLNPEATQRIIHLDDSNLGSIFEIRKRIEAGEMVALSADRPGVNDRSVEVDFLGGKASFPTAPFLVASLLKCPVVLTFALFRAPNHYELYCEPFADVLALERKDRDRDLAVQVQQFARRVEHYCRKAPDNWFNFYDFWSPPPPASNT